MWIFKKKIREFDAQKPARKNAYRTHVVYWLIIINMIAWYVAYVSVDKFVDSISDSVENITLAPRTARARETPEPVKSEREPNQDSPSKNAIYAPENLKAAATRVCDENNIKEVWCRNDLLALSNHETAGWVRFEGDGGCSTGWFHINRCVHVHVTKDQSMNFEWAAQWSLKRMIHYGYPVYRTQALQSHNGIGVNNGYAQRIKTRSERIK